MIHGSERRASSLHDSTYGAVSSSRNSPWYADRSFIAAFAVSLLAHVLFVAFGPEVRRPQARKTEVVEIRLIEPAKPPPPPPEPPPEPVVKPKPAPKPVKLAKGKPPRKAASAPRLSAKADLPPPSLPAPPASPVQPRIDTAPRIAGTVRPEVGAAAPRLDPRQLAVPDATVLPQPARSESRPLAGAKAVPDLRAAPRLQASTDVPRLTAPSVQASADVPAARRPDPVAAPKPSLQPEIRAAIRPEASTDVPRLTAPSVQASADAPAARRPDPVAAPKPSLQPEIRAAIRAEASLDVPRAGAAVPAPREDHRAPHRVEAVAPARPELKPDVRPDPRPDVRPAVAAAPSARPPVETRPDGAAPAIVARPAESARAPARSETVVVAKPAVSVMPDAHESVEGPRSTAAPVLRTESSPVSRPAPVPIVRPETRPAERPVIAEAPARDTPVAVAPLDRPVPPIKPVPEAHRVETRPEVTRTARPDVALEKPATARSADVVPPASSAARPELQAARTEPAKEPRPAISVDRPAIVVSAAAPGRPKPSAVPSLPAAPVLGRGKPESAHASGPQAAAEGTSRPEIAPVPGTGAVDRAALEAYGLRLSREIGKDQRYPKRAQMTGQQGTTEVLVRMGRDAKIKDVTVAKSSGFALLDEEAIEKVKRVRTLPRPPDDFKGREFTVMIPIVFRLE
ncbi:MAG: TonB family protein [Betaproteobacteria bacterium]|nr:TonB family protein [Betaproteobacteria bacterium]